MDYKKDVPNRKEVEEKLKTVGDYVKMDYLQRCLRQTLDFDTRRFVLLTLSEIYEKRGMFLESGKLLRHASEINPTEMGKKQELVKSAELFVKGNNFDEADTSFKKALIIAGATEKRNLDISRKNMYRKYADECLAKGKRRQAVDTYERLLTIDLDAGEKEDIKKNLIILYEKLGKIREFYNLKRGM